MTSNFKKKIKKSLLVLQRILLWLFGLIPYQSKQNSEKTFVIGVTEISNSIFYLKKVFSKNTISVCFGKNHFYDNKYDYHLDIKNRQLSFIANFFYGPYLLNKISNQADTFIYFWSTGFCLDRQLDYQFLKKKNKKIVCIFCGDDIRSRILALAYFSEHELDSYVEYDNPKLHLDPMYDAEKKRIAILADQFADMIFSHPIDQLSYLKSEQYTLGSMIKNELLQKEINKFSKGVIKIVHAPSNPVAKGTPLVRAAIKKLQIEGYQFEYVECIDLKNEVVLRELSSAHIVLNQFYAFIPGVFGVEAMASCNAVLMSADYDFSPKGAEKAWLRTRYWEIYDNLKYLLDHPEKIKEYALAGYDFVYQNYREEAVRKRLLNLFVEKNIISSEIQQEISAKYTDEAILNQIKKQ